MEPGTFPVVERNVYLTMKLIASHKKLLCVTPDANFRIIFVFVFVFKKSI